MTKRNHKTIRRHQFRANNSAQKNILITHLTPRELAAEMPPKISVGMQDCLHKMLAISIGRQDCLHFKSTMLPALPTFYVGNPACLPPFLEAFPPPVREGLTPRELSSVLPSKITNFGRQAGLPTFCVDDTACQIVLYVGNRPACLPNF